MVADKLKISHMNVGSMRLANRNEVLQLIVRTDDDIFIVSETWLSDDICENERYRIEGYRGVFLNRNKDRGGGVAIYIKKSLDYEKLPTNSCKEWYILPVRILAYDIIVCGVYMNNKVHYKRFMKHFVPHVQRHKCIIYGGDFNTDLSIKQIRDKHRYQLRMDRTDMEILNDETQTHENHSGKASLIISTRTCILAGSSMESSQLKKYHISAIG